VSVQFALQVLLLPAEYLHQLPHHQHLTLHILEVVLASHLLVTAEHMTESEKVSDKQYQEQMKESKKAGKT
jgi:hypothetical protein